MNQRILFEKLNNGDMVYIKDDFEEACIRLSASDGHTTSFLKHRGRKEVEVSQSYEAVGNIILGGEEIGKEEYDKY